MKKLAVCILAAYMLATLSGCHIRHDMLPATCTEPSTCSVCGKTEGEPLGHTEVTDEAAAPTCTETGLTEGSHCEVCGEVLVPQETVEALGHTEVTDEAAAPTCTETGLTEGSHCEVCGEVLVPQEMIEALGHDWEDASFSEPKTCRVCGETEGEALGTELFIRALNPPLPEEEIAEAAEKILENAAGDEEEAVPDEAEASADITGAADETEPISIHKDIRISGHSHGLGEIDDFFETSSFAMITDVEDKQAMFRAETVINGSKPLNVFIAKDEKGFGFTLPGITEDYYYVSSDTLMELLGSSAESFMPEASAGTSPEEMAAQLEELFGNEEIRELILKYERILFGVVSVHNAKETRTDYLLPALGKTQSCLVLEIHPDAGDWRVMLRKLLTTAAADEDLKNKLIIPLAELAYAYDETTARYYESPEKYAEAMADGFRESLSSALEDVDSAAEALAEYGFTVAYDGGRVYALRVHDGNDYGFSYESYGTTETDREDVLVTKSDEGEKHLAYNSVRARNGRVTGRLELNDAEMTLGYDLGGDESGKPFFDIRFSSGEYTCKLSFENEADIARVKALLDTAEADAELEAVVSETEERLSVPGQKKILETEEDFSEAFGTISREIRMAELFGHTWTEATCTEPRTCEVCGETEGRPLGHDWEAATCTEPRTCRRCGETEGEPLGHDWGATDSSGVRTCKRCGETETLFADRDLSFSDDGKGYSRLTLSEEQKEALDEVDQIIMQAVDNGYLYLGRLSSAGRFSDEDGALLGTLDPDWFTINGIPATFLQIREYSAEDGALVIQGIIPFICNEEYYYMLVNESEGTVSVEDILTSDGESAEGLTDRDRVQIVGDFYDSSLSFRDTDVIGEEITLREAKNISLQSWPDKDAITAFYILTDKDGNYYYSDDFYP